MCATMINIKKMKQMLLFEDTVILKLFIIFLG